MALNSGYIKLHRSITTWEWYQDANVSRVFIHLLLTANYKPSQWQGLTILPGQRIASIAKLSDELQISVKCIRTALEQLESTGEVQKKSTNRFTVFTVVNYEKYQDRANEEQTKPTDNPQNRASKGQTDFADVSTFAEGGSCNWGKQRANKHPKTGQTEGKQRATKEEDKEIEEYINIKEYKKEINNSGGESTRAPETDERAMIGALFEKYWGRVPAEQDYTAIQTYVELQHPGEQSLSVDDVELLKIAFEASVSAGKRTLSYVGGVFKNFRKRGIKTLDDYKRNEARRNKKATQKRSKSNASYDLDEFERQILERPIVYRRREERG